LKILQITVSEIGKGKLGDFFFWRRVVADQLCNFHCSALNLGIYSAREDFQCQKPKRESLLEGKKAMIEVNNQIKNMGVERTLIYLTLVTLLMNIIMILLEADIFKILSG
jgi:hypothetical protein